MAGADAFAFALYAAVITWLPTYHNEELGLSLTHVGFITSALPFAGLIAIFVGGALAALFPESPGALFEIDEIILDMGCRDFMDPGPVLLFRELAEQGQGVLTGLDRAVRAAVGCL